MLARVLVHVRTALFLPGRVGYLDSGVFAYFLSGQAVYFAADSRHLRYMRKIASPGVIRGIEALDVGDAATTDFISEWP